MQNQASIVNAFPSVHPSCNLPNLPHTPLKQRKSQTRESYTKGSLVHEDHQLEKESKCRSCDNTDQNQIEETITVYNQAMLLRGYSPGMCRLEMACPLSVLVFLSTGPAGGVASTGVSASRDASSLTGTGASISCAGCGSDFGTLPVLTAITLTPPKPLLALPLRPREAPVPGTACSC